MGRGGLFGGRVQIVEKQSDEKEEVVEGVDDAQGDMEAEEQKCAVEDKE